MTRRQNRGRGFTLIEIAVTLVIVGLLAAGMIAMLTTFLKATRSRVAAENSTVIQQSLQRFVERYGRLPCPAVPIAPPTPGIEDAAGCPAVAVGATQMARGVIPWVSLGLPLDQVEDGYGRMFTYHVTISATQTTAITVSGMRGNMTLHSATPVAMGLPPPNTRNQLNSCWSAAGAPAATENSCNMNAAVVLISHGENGLGGFTRDGAQLPAPTSAGEIENADVNVAFVKGEPNATGFDDLVFARSPDDFLEPLARLGTIKSGAGVTNEVVKNAAISVSNLMVNSVAPPNAYEIPLVSPVVPLPADAWGNLVTYTMNQPVGTQLCSLVAGAVVFTINAVGVDAVAGINPNTGRNDDVSVRITVDLLRSQINNRPGFLC